MAEGIRRVCALDLDLVVTTIGNRRAGGTTTMPTKIGLLYNRV